MIFNFKLYSRDVFNFILENNLERELEAVKYHNWKRRKDNLYYKRLILDHLELDIDYRKNDVDDWILNWAGIKGVPIAIDYVIGIQKTPNLWTCVDHARYYPYLMNFFLKFEWTQIHLKNFITEDPNYDQRLMNYLRKLQL